MRLVFNFLFLFILMSSKHSRTSDCSHINQLGPKNVNKLVKVHAFNLIMFAFKFMYEKRICNAYTKQSTKQTYHPGVSHTLSLNGKQSNEKTVRSWMVYSCWLFCLQSTALSIVNTASKPLLNEGQREWGMSSFYTSHEI